MKKMRFNKIFTIPILLLPAILCGCSASRENTYNNQEAKIDKYLSSVTASITYPGTTYKNYWEKEEKSNKKGPRSLNLGPCGFNIYLLDMRHTHNQLNLSNVP